MNVCMMMRSKNLHCAKSHRPFELFVNENCELGNELNQMQHLREVRLKIPQRNPLSAAFDDGSA